MALPLPFSLACSVAGASALTLVRLVALLLIGSRFVASVNAPEDGKLLDAVLPF